MEQCSTQTHLKISRWACRIYDQFASWEDDDFCL